MRHKALVRKTAKMTNIRTVYDADAQVNLDCLL